MTHSIFFDKKSGLCNLIWVHYSSMYTYKGICTRVVDGDTVDITLDLGFNTLIKNRFRLYGIDSPETFGVKHSSEEYKAGIKSKEKLAELIENKEVTVKTFKDKKGKYGRYIAVIYIDDLCINDFLVREGFAEKI